MLGEIEPSLLQDDYMEKDMKRGFLSFLYRLFKKTASELEYNPLHLTISQDLNSVPEHFNCTEEIEIQEIHSDDSNKKPEETNTIGNFESLDDADDKNVLSISIFKKNIRTLIKIISGIVAAFILIIGIVIILLKRHKSGTKLYEKKIQIIY
jgi:ATP-dependent Zn protease